ncbi:hypothetical protein LINGRAHAP2_LOCUS28705 [Linum grandiflorum]
MGYTADNGKVTAELEVWKLASKIITKDIQRFKKKGCPEYSKLYFLFGDTSATRAFAKAAATFLSDDEDKKWVKDAGLNEVKFERSEDTDEVKEISKPSLGKRKYKVDAHARKKPHTEEDGGIKQILVAMVETSKHKAALWEQKMASGDSKVASLLDCMALLEVMEIDDTVFTKSLGILQATSDFRQCFLKMNEKRRMGWVKNLGSDK